MFEILGETPERSLRLVWDQFKSDIDRALRIRYKHETDVAAIISEEELAEKPGALSIYVSFDPRVWAKYGVGEILNTFKRGVTSIATMADLTADAEQTHVWRALVRGKDHQGRDNGWNFNLLQREDLRPDPSAPGKPLESWVGIDYQRPRKPGAEYNPFNSPYVKLSQAIEDWALYSRSRADRPGKYITIKDRVLGVYRSEIKRPGVREVFEALPDELSELKEALDPDNLSDLHGRHKRFTQDDGNRVPALKSIAEQKEFLLKERGIDPLLLDAYKKKKSLTGRMAQLQNMVAIADYDEPTRRAAWQQIQKLKKDFFDDRDATVIEMDRVLSVIARHEKEIMEAVGKIADDEVRQEVGRRLMGMRAWDDILKFREDMFEVLDFLEALEGGDTLRTYVWLGKLTLRLHRSLGNWAQQIRYLNRWVLYLYPPYFLAEIGNFINRRIPIEGNTVGFGRHQVARRWGFRNFEFVAFDRQQFMDPQGLAHSVGWEGQKLFWSKDFAELGKYVDTIDALKEVGAIDEDQLYTYITGEETILGGGRSRGVLKLLEDNEDLLKDILPKEEWITAEELQTFAGGAREKLVSMIDGHPKGVEGNIYKVKEVDAYRLAKFFKGKNLHQPCTGFLDTFGELLDRAQAFVYEDLPRRIKPLGWVKDKVFGPYRRVLETVERKWVASSAGQAVKRVALKIAVKAAAQKGIVKAAGMLLAQAVGAIASAGMAVAVYIGTKLIKWAWLALRGQGEDIKKEVAKIGGVAAKIVKAPFSLAFAGCIGCSLLLTGIPALIAIFVGSILTNLTSPLAGLIPTPGAPLGLVAEKSVDSDHQFLHCEQVSGEDRLARFEIWILNDSDETLTLTRVDDNQFGQSWAGGFGIPTELMPHQTHILAFDGLIPTFDPANPAECPQIFENTVTVYGEYSTGPAQATAAAYVYLGYDEEDVEFPLGWPTRCGCIVQGPGGGYTHTNLQAIDIVPYKNVADPACFSFYPFTPDLTIFSTFRGMVGAVNTDPSGVYGKYVDVDSLGHGFSARYAHLDSISVSLGQEVMRGAVIGKMGNTGNSSETHLHYEFRNLTMAPPYVPRVIPACSSEPVDPLCKDVMIQCYIGAW